MFQNVFIMFYGEFLREKRKAAKLTQEELAAHIRARGHNITGSYISMIERGYDKTRDGTPTRVNKEFVRVAAEVLDWDVNDALIKADYAPKTITRRPETIPELVAALEQLGIEAPQPFGGYPRDDDGEGYREVVERIWLDIELVMNRLGKK